MRLENQGRPVAFPSFFLDKPKPVRIGSAGNGHRRPQCNSGTAILLSLRRPSLRVGRASGRAARNNWYGRGRQASGGHGVGNMKIEVIEARHSPCRDCTKRHMSCWTVCAEYIAFREKLAREHALRAAERAADDVAYQMGRGAKR